MIVPPSQDPLRERADAGRVGRSPASNRERGGEGEREGKEGQWRINLKVKKEIVCRRKIERCRAIQRKKVERKKTKTEKTRDREIQR